MNNEQKVLVACKSAKTRSGIEKETSLTPQEIDRCLTKLFHKGLITIASGRWITKRGGY